MGTNDDNNDRKDLKLSINERFQRKMYSLGKNLGEKTAKKENERCEKLGVPVNTAVHQPIYRTKNEYVYFGTFPQTIKASDVAIGAQVGYNLYMGNDGNVYCKKTYKTKKTDKYAGKFTYAYATPPNNTLLRYSNGQRAIESDYFKMEPIKWRIIHRENGILTLISEKTLYSTEMSQDDFTITPNSNWASSNIRKELNQNFFLTAFSAEEQRCILSTELVTEAKNPAKYGKAFNATTEDRVFILSKNELSYYGLNSADIVKESTDFCGPGYDFIQDSPSTPRSHWLLRTTNPDTTKDTTILTTANNGKTFEGAFIHIDIAPVVRIREDAVKIYSDGSVNTGTYTTATEYSTPTPTQTQQAPKKITLKQRIFYTILAPVCWFLGMFLAEIIVQGGSSGNLFGLIMLAYLVFSEVMVWKIKSNIILLRIIVLLNVPLVFVCWTIANKL